MAQTTDELATVRRRQTANASAFQHALRLRTKRPIRPLEDWLSQCCAGRWEIRVEGVSNDLEVKQYLFYFSLADDRAAFKYAISQPGLPPRPDLPRPAKAKAMSLFRRLMR